MKVSIDEFNTKLSAFLKEVSQTPRDQANRFLAAAALDLKAQEIRRGVGMLADADGMVDTDAVKHMIDAGFEASGGLIQVPIGHPVLAFLKAQPEIVDITKADSDKFFAAFQKQ